MDPGRTTKFRPFSDRGRLSLPKTSLSLFLPRSLALFQALPANFAYLSQLPDSFRASFRLLSASFSPIPAYHHSHLSISGFSNPFPVPTYYFRFCQSTSGFRYRLYSIQIAYFHHSAYLLITSDSKYTTSGLLRPLPIYIHTISQI